MNEPWFPAWVGGVIGSGIGLLGAIYGTVVGICAPRGIAKTFVYGLHFFCLAISVVLLIAGITALSLQQPYHVWYGLGLSGMIGTILFSSFTFMLFLRYRQFEERKMLAADLN